jgi:hypothetical protein
MRILMIHGIAQGGKNPEHLKATWLATLQQGFKNARQPFPTGVNADFPYYGDLLDQLVEQSELPSTDEVIAKGSGQNTQFEQFMQSALQDLQRGANIPQEEVSAHMDGTGPQAKGIQNWGWVRAIARAIDRRYSDTSSFLIEEFLRDVYLYIASPAVQQQVNNVVEKLLTEEPTVVIGHSLGSVVGYNVIRKRHATTAFAKYVTVGSPLGIRAITAKLGLLENDLRKDGWYNAFDPRDIVALNPLNDDNFPTDPAIVNFAGVNNPTDNRHGIIGYLNNTSVARQIASALTGRL